MLCSISHAISDIERGALFFSNALSMGTLLPEMEGEIQKIKLEYKKKRAEFHNLLESNRKSFLKQSISIRIEELEKYTSVLKTQKARIETQQSTFREVLIGSKDLYSGIQTRESLLEELKQRSIDTPKLMNEWQDLVQLATSKNLEQITPDDFELILIQALEIESMTAGMEFEISEELKTAEEDIIQLQKFLKDLK